MPYDTVGWIHTIAAVIALISGSVVLYKPKGTQQHILTGRIYGIAMLIVCGTSFMIYRVHGMFGILHVFAMISTLTLALGMLPLYLKWSKNYLVQHLSWMYWSVIGLYCAFAAEIFTRLPRIFNMERNFVLFYLLIGISSGFVGYLGARRFKVLGKKWKEIFASGS